MFCIRYIELVYGFDNLLEYMLEFIIVYRNLKFRALFI